MCSDDAHHDVLLSLLPPKKTAAVFSTYIKNRGSQLVYLFFFSKHTQVSCAGICPKAKTQTETGAQKSAHTLHSISLPWRIKIYSCTTQRNAPQTEDDDATTGCAGLFFAWADWPASKVESCAHPPKRRCGNSWVWSRMGRPRTPGNIGAQKGPQKQGFEH